MDTAPTRRQNKKKQLKEETEDDDEIRITTDEEDIVVRLSQKEQRILEDCRKVSVYYFSLPTATVLASLAYHAQSRGVLKESKRFSRPPLSRAPKTLAFSLLGYALGQVLYMYSSDCAERFLQQAPHGEMARVIRKIREGNVAVDEEDLQSPAPVLATPQPESDYVMPAPIRLYGIESTTVDDLIKESLDDTENPS